VEELDVLIRRADQSDHEAIDQLFSMLYHELHRLAEANLRHAGSALTLGTTTLLHETYLNIAGRKDIAFAERARFLAYASRAMRGLVIDYARRRRAKKRGSQFEITLGSEEPPPASNYRTQRSWSDSVRRSMSWASSSPRWPNWWTCTSSAAFRSPKLPRSAKSPNARWDAIGARQGYSCTRHCSTTTTETPNGSCRRRHSPLPRTTTPG